MDEAKAIQSISSGKSPGHDGLSVEYLRHGGPHMSRVLALLYNLCISHLCWPHDLTKTVVVSMIKNKTGNVLDIGNYRPIALATIVAKVLDGLLNIYK